MPASRRRPVARRPSAAVRVLLDHAAAAAQPGLRRRSPRCRGSGAPGPFASSRPAAAAAGARAQGPRHAAHRPGVRTSGSCSRVLPRLDPAAVDEHVPEPARAQRRDDLVAGLAAPHLVVEEHRVAAAANSPSHRDALAACAAAARFSLGAAATASCRARCPRRTPRRRARAPRAADGKSILRACATW